MDIRCNPKDARDYIEAHAQSGLLANGGRLIKGLNLKDVNFARYTLKDNRFEGCDLRGAYFFKADISGCEFVDCDLRGADFTKANMEGVTFEDCTTD